MALFGPYHRCGWSAATFPRNEKAAAPDTKAKFSPEKQQQGKCAKAAEQHEMKVKVRHKSRLKKGVCLERSVLTSDRMVRTYGGHRGGALGKEPQVCPPRRPLGCREGPVEGSG